MKDLQITSQFEQLFGSELLTGDDHALIAGLQDELVQTLRTTQIHRTRTEMEVSILNSTKFPTPAAKYWQATREQGVMFNELIILSFDYRKRSVEVKILMRKFEAESDNLEKELLKIEIEKESYVMSNQERVAKARIREIQDWSEIKGRERALMDDAELSGPDHHQLISYTKRWIKQSILMGENGSPAERQNLLGELRSGLLACIKNGLLGIVLDDFPDHIQKQIKSDYGVN